MQLFLTIGYLHPKHCLNLITYIFYWNLSETSELFALLGELCGPTGFIQVGPVSRVGHVRDAVERDIVT